MDHPGIHSLISQIQGHLHFLGHRPEPRDLERWALRLYRAMAGRGRLFHRQRHAQEMTQGADPIAALAALFHDAVYVQVDLGLPAAFEPALARYARPKDGGYVLAEAEPGDPVSLVYALFGVAAGDVLGPYGGVNELLSAVAAAVDLGPVLSRGQLAELTCAIEGTIPFRGPDKAGERPFDRLARRLGELDARAGLGLGPAGVDRAVRRAVWLARKDVENFAHDDPGRFLDNTWLLLPETNPSLADPDVYTVKEYRAALQKMEWFLGTLSGDRVFHRFGDEPSASEHARLASKAERNIALASRYLGAKLLGAAVLEALAALSGGDAPLSLFMGQLPSRNPSTPRLERWLPWTEASSECDPTVLRLLEAGRTSEVDFDMRQAPLGAFVYRALGDRRQAAALRRAKAFFAGELEGRAFLRALEPALVEAVAQAVSRMSAARGDGLRARPWEAPV